MRNAFREDSRRASSNCCNRFSFLFFLFILRFSSCLSIQLYNVSSFFSSFFFCDSSQAFAFDYFDSQRLPITFAGHRDSQKKKSVSCHCFVSLTRFAVMKTFHVKWGAGVSRPANFSIFEKEKRAHAFEEVKRQYISPIDSRRSPPASRGYKLLVIEYETSSANYSHGPVTDN